MEKKKIETIKIEVDGELNTPPKKWEKTNFKKPKNTLFSSYDEDLILSKIIGHPVLIGYITAFSDHLPMTISPDIIWQLILLGFAQHVDLNSERLREKFVDFKGKKKLIVERLDLTLENAKKEDWEDIVNEFCSKLNENVSEDLIDILTPKFTTTDHISKASAQMSIMSSMKHYFDYECMICGCGIPYINLEGTLDDWVELKKKTENLKKYEINWWIETLIPILDKIVETKKGNIDIEFWRDFIKINKKEVTRYGPSGMRKWTEKHDFISGWMIKFFPYDSRGQRLEKFDYTEKKYVPEHMCDTPMTLTLVALNKSLNTVFKSGFIGIKQDEETFAVKPVIGWYLLDESSSTSNDKNTNFCMI